MTDSVKFHTDSFNSLSMIGKQIELAIIVPLYNESSSIENFYDRLCSALERIEELTLWALFFVNDASTDNSLEKLLELRERDSRVNVITLSRNFGYQSALQAGLRVAKGTLYAIIDVDCEDPPELLKDFYQGIRKEQVELAYGIRSNRDEPAWVVFCRGLFYKINRMIADSETILWMAEFSMFTENVKSAILEPKTTYPFLRTEMAYVGFKRKGFNYFRETRKFGKSHYNLWRMTTFAVGGFLASSTFPLRLVLYLGGAIAVLVLLIWVIFKLSLGTMANISCILMLYYLVFSLPMISLYLARAYKNGVYRPLYIIDPARTFVNKQSET